MSWLKSLRRPKVFIPLIVALLIISAFAAAVHNLNSPAQGVVTTQTSVDSSAPTTPDHKNYSDSIISFDYPGTYSPQPVDKTAPYIDSVKLVSTALRDRFAVISIVKESLADDSGVSYRRLHPDLYKIVTASASTDVFAKNDQTEYTGFIEHGDRVIAISLTSVSAADLASDYSRIAGSLKWNQ